MGKCVPGMPCYNDGVIVYTTYPSGCSTLTPSPCTLPLSSDCLYYAGPNLPYSGVQTEDSITEALQKIDLLLSPASIFNLFFQAIESDPSLMILLCSKLEECS